MKYNETLHAQNLHKCTGYKIEYINFCFLCISLIELHKRPRSSFNRYICHGDYIIIMANYRDTLDDQLTAQHNR